MEPERTISVFVDSLDFTMSVPKMMQAYSGVSYTTTTRFIEAMNPKTVVFDTVLDRLLGEGRSQKGFGGGGIYDTKLARCFDTLQVEPMGPFDDTTEDEKNFGTFTPWIGTSDQPDVLVSHLSGIDHAQHKQSVGVVGD